MKKIFFLIFIAIIGQVEKTIAQNILVIPFDDRMFYNQASAEMLKASNMKYSAMVNAFTNGLISAIQQKGGRKIISPQGVTTQGTQEDITLLIRSSLHFYLEDLPYGQKKKKKLFGCKKSKLSNKNNSPNKHQQGEVISLIGDNTNKFINSKVIDRKTFIKTVSKTNVDKVLVINELDIKEDFSSPYNNGNEHLRQIQVHYTLFDNKGKIITGGVAVKNFSSNENDVKTIIKKYFGEIAAQIVKNL